MPAAIGVRALRCGGDPDLLPDPLKNCVTIPDETFYLAGWTAAVRAQCRTPATKAMFPWMSGGKTLLPDGARASKATPLKTYFAKLKLWYRCSEAPDEIIGPLVAERLQGRAQRIALELKLIRPDGTYDVGDVALVRLSVDEVVDPNDGVTIIQRAIPSGVQALCNALHDAFGDRRPRRWRCSSSTKDLTARISKSSRQNGT